MSTGSRFPASLAVRFDAEVAARLCRHADARMVHRNVIVDAALRLYLDALDRHDDVLPEQYRVPGGMRRALAK